MNELTPLQAFHVFYRYIIADNELGDESWEVSDVLSMSNTSSNIARHSGGPTADPAVWQEWCVITEEVLQDEKLRIANTLQSDVLLTREQALIVMSCFLQKRYWNKNHDMLLKDALADINHFLSQENLESTEIWKQWLECVPAGLAFKETFDEAYIQKLFEIRCAFWDKQEAMNFSLKSYIKNLMIFTVLSKWFKRLLSKIN